MTNFELKTEREFKTVEELELKWNEFLGDLLNGIECATESELCVYEKVLDNTISALRVNHKEEHNV